MCKKPLVIGHRGNSSNAPANTIESIHQAIELGVDMIELDVRMSKDGIPVLIHNDTVDETTNGHGAVSSLTLAQLKELDAGSWKGKQYANEKIPTLAEALEFAKGKVTLSLDLKDEAVINCMIRDIYNADMSAEVVICGCCEPQAEQIWNIDRNITVLFNTDPQLDKLAKLEDRTEFINTYIYRACRERFSVLNVSYKFVNEELIYRAHLRGLSVWVWTVDDVEEMKKLIYMGVDAIYSNFPGKLLEIRNNLLGNAYI
ncbi:MAG: glycerophosphodiester phosphodiesterase [bacterium]